MLSSQSDQAGRTALTTASDIGSDTALLGSDLLDHISTCTCDACMNPDRFPDRNEDATTPVDGGSNSAAETATLQTMSDFLVEGFWDNGTGLRHNLAATGTDANNGVLHYNLSGFGELPFGGGSDINGVTAERAELIRDVFDVYEAVLGIDFVETTSTDDSVVDFFFSDNDSGAYAGSASYNDGTIYYSYLNIAENWSNGTSALNTYSVQTMFHEIGHALGLGHQGFYNGTGRYVDDAIFELDSWQASMMSYFSQTENTAIVADREFVQTPMAVDWLALDAIYSQYGYGISNAFEGNTTYGFNTTISENESAIWNAYSDYADRSASTIVDAGGIDTLDVSGYSADQNIDLTVQTASQTYQNTSDIGGRIGNLTLAIGTVIENAVGGSGDDTIVGNSANNVFEGGAGDDTFTGLLGDDTFYGDAGFDTVVYSSFYDSYTFSLVNSAIEVIGEGIDLVFDTIENFQFSDVAYSFATIFDSLTDTTPDPAVPSIVGSSGRDTLVGTDQSEQIEGLDGNDTLRGGGGDDIIIGGKGSDYQLYGDSGADIFVFNQGDGVGVIRDFEDGTDRIQITGGLQFDDLSIVQNTNLGRFTIQGPDGFDSKIVVMYQTDTAALTQGDFIFADVGAPVDENDAPTVVNDTAISTAGMSTIIDVLSNDTDPDGDTLSISSVDFDPTIGDVSILPDGSLAFVPSNTFNALALGESADVSFTYTATDGEFSATATVTVTINGSSDGTGPSLPLIVGTDGRNSLTGTDISEQIEGLGGNDIIRGGGGDDIIIAGKGSDYSIYGDDGADIFVFNQGDGVGIIRDFEDGIDRILFEDGILFDDLTINHNANLNRFTITGPDGYDSKVVAIYNDAATNLTADDFIFG